MPKATADAVNVGEVAVGYAVWQPGWQLVHRPWPDRGHGLV
jgi:hypothetical protein